MPRRDWMILPSRYLMTVQKLGISGVFILPGQGEITLSWASGGVIRNGSDNFS